jgi:hypothetical protein
MGMVLNELTMHAQWAGTTHNNAPTTDARRHNANKAGAMAGATWQSVRATQPHSGAQKHE